ncbi:MAG TPA: family 43 glycosylhydrolase [Paludibacteraceae bacterium]|nr:family 43 glycosylhydrolase [Paludibacteraceae bacterium]
MNKNILSMLFALLCMGMPYTNSKADNPICQGYYTPDPAPMIYNDTLFVYSGNDEGGSFFTMNNWHLMSTTDMVNWTDRGIIFGHGDINNAKPAGDWASQCIYRDGKFYYYVTIESSLGGRAVVVGVGDKPDGPFKDVLGKALAGPNWDYIDPTVFIDDDEQAYLYWGNPKLYYAKLNKDMISFDGSIQVTDMSRGFAPNGESSKYTEGPWIHKRGKKYYMIYASHGIPESISYSWSDSPTGPWEWKGVIMGQSSGFAFTNHSGIIDYMGRSFFFYHTAKLPGGGGYTRSTQIEEFTYGADGSIPSIAPTDLGVKNPIHYLGPYVRQESETMAFSNGIRAFRGNGRGVYVGWCHNNDYIKVRSVDFGDTGCETFTLAAEALNRGGSVEIHVDKKDGAVIGKVDIANTNGWKEITVDVDRVTDVHDIFFVVKGGSGELFNLDYWFFETSGVRVPQGAYNDTPAEIPGVLEAENYDVGGSCVAYYDEERANQGEVYREDGVDVVEINDGGYAIGYTSTGEWVEYTIDVKKTTQYDITGRFSAGLDGGGVQLYLDGKELTANIEALNTGDWDTYQTVDVASIDLEEGSHVLRMMLTGPYVNIDWLKFTDPEGTNVTEVKAREISDGNFIIVDITGRYYGEISLTSGMKSEAIKKVKDIVSQSGIYFLKSLDDTITININ